MAVGWGIKWPWEPEGIHVNAEKRTRNNKAASPEWLDAAGKLGGSGEKEM